jgi:putative oxidoreductase
MATFISRINGLLAPAKHIPESVTLLLARIAIFFVFWRSAQTKISGAEFLDQSWAFWNVSDTTRLLFEYEYDLPLIPANIAASLATYAEFFLSLLILVGLFSRISALGFLLMTAVIQFLVYPGAWPTHILWAALLLYVLKDGPGKLSLDHLLGKS